MSYRVTLARLKKLDRPELTERAYADDGMFCALGAVLPILRTLPGADMEASIRVLCAAYPEIEEAVTTELQMTVEEAYALQQYNDNVLRSPTTPYNVREPGKARYRRVVMWLETKLAERSKK